MTTIQKGNSFEDKVFNFFKNLIDSNDFYIQKEYCKIFAKKGYYSKDRKKDIVFDITIEVYLPNKSQYSILIILECKNYNHKVPVDDLEEFYSKLSQVSGSKGILVSSNAFQEGAFNFAESKNIGLLRYRDKSDLDWILERSPSGIVSSKYASKVEGIVYHNLRSDKYQNNYFDCHTFFNYKYTNSMTIFIKSLINYETDEAIVNFFQDAQSAVGYSKNIVDYINDEQMERIAEETLSRINYQGGKVNLDFILEYFEKNNDLKVYYNSDLESGVLGEINFNTLEIFIDNKQCNNLVRRRFTVAHELGHYILKHSKYMKGEKYTEKLDINLEKPFSIGIDDIARMEWQANQFASYVLLPQKEFLKDFFYYANLYKLNDKGFGLLYLDNQGCNISTFINISSPLMQKYKVSRSVIKIRLKKLGLLKEINRF